MYRKYFKRLFDVLVSLVGLLLASPVLLITWLCLLVQNNGRPFFYQERPGLNHRSFKIIKFKSMNDKRDAQGQLLPDVERITFLGKWIRKLSIDELPQLFNVIKGDMSLVGPRPLLFKYLPLYSQEQDRRHTVKPGITGWAQVNGRNAISWTKKFEFDLYYVDHLSFYLDLKILLLTVKKVLAMDGVNQSARRPMQPFNGQN